MEEYKTTMESVTPGNVTDLSGCKQFADMGENVDRIDQPSLINSAIVTGLNSDCQKKEKVISFAREVLGVNMFPEEITSIGALGINKDGFSITKIGFIGTEAKIKFYRGRVNLRGIRFGNIWINEELTKPCSHLDFLARLMFKKGMIKKNWTFLENIYIKHTILVLGPKRKEGKTQAPSE